MIRQRKPSTSSTPQTSKAGNGTPIYDPSANVLALVVAAVDRLNDLRNAETRRIDDLREAEQRRVDEQAHLRAEYDDKLREAEAKRIDAIRAVDVNAVAVASERAADQAAVLANQVVASAEALRTLVASTAATATTTQAQSTLALSTRLTTLEQAQYQSQGKQAVADPAMAEIVSEMKRYMTSSERRTGKGEGVGMFAAIAAAVLSLLIAAGSLVYTITAARPQQIEIAQPAATSTIAK